ncbi:uncharacterized protein LOC114516860 [Dendronephthya gigantea]|uniref:uncharacterized protein LOC114516860 n=1 Tax=Dendronephthya gigantea TaxID=151771 RepID=UPI001069667D|nr:uncharacterized protein LOC114516860 [Dendronephthya gigantea]XP_028392254.1 uncharacterized protein LOC114516860 [Dendronephthya gigantea]
MAQIPKGFDYIKSVPFFLKIGAFILLFIALITLGVFLDKGSQDVTLTNHKKVDSFDHWGRKGGLDFGMFVIVVSWLQVILLVVLFVTGLHEKISVINWPLTVAINMVIWGLLLFISGCVIADTAVKYDEKKFSYSPWSFCDFLKLSWVNSDARCGHLVGSAAICIITTIVFGVDAFFNFQLWRGKEAPSAGPAAVPT